MSEYSNLNVLSTCWCAGTSTSHEREMVAQRIQFLEIFQIESFSVAHLYENKT